jgi:serine/threonine-protein kinase
MSRDLGDRYTLHDEIGRGSIGIIHRAVDGVLDRPVAVKRLRPEHLRHERHRTRFLREAHICARLAHPNIVPVYDVGEIGGAPALVMSLLAGRSLRTVLRAGHFGLARLLGWFTQVCNGLAFAHDAGIIHRDVKPAHIFVGDFGQVVLTDWGLARRMRTALESDDVEADGGRDVTRVGDVVGTPAYMAPEQAEGRVGKVDHRADIYALGAILYEILTGTRPYEATSSLDVIRAVREGPPEAPSQRAPHRNIPPDVEAVCLRAMAREPSDRFDSALDLAANIEARLESGEVRARATQPEALPPLSLESPAERTAAADADAARRLAEGRAEAAAYVRHRREAAALRSQAARQRAALPEDATREQLAEVWRLDIRHRDALDRAAWHFVQAADALAEAMPHAALQAEAREVLARLHRDAWHAAEQAGDPVSAQFHRARAEACDDGSMSDELAGRSALSVHTTPAGAVVDLSTVDDRVPVWMQGARLRLGETPLSGRTVSATRAVLRLTAPDGLVARLPLRLEPGESRVMDLRLPRSKQVPPGFVFVAGGRFVMGADDHAPGAALPREVDVASFCIARQPVLWEAWFEFLEDLLAVGVDASAHFPRKKGRALVTVEDRNVRWRKDVEAPPGSPVRCVSHDDAVAYAVWLSRRLGARLRLPTEEEWEYAAGAGDGRLYPWGDRFVPGLADADQRSRSGPAPVQAWPDDESPFGVRSVAGGVREWTSSAADPGRFLLRGGSWRARPEQCRLCARATGAHDLTHETIGIRLAADLPD